MNKIDNFADINRVVLFGAGEYAKDAIVFLKQNNLVPIFFCDRDKSKQDTTLYDIPIYSFEKIIPLLESRISRILFYVTPCYPAKGEIFNLLLQSGVKDEQIINYEECELRFSCEYVEKRIVVSESRLSHCCYADDDIKLNANTFPGVTVGDDIEMAVGQLIVHKKMLSQEMSDYSVSGECASCTNLKKGYFPKSTKIDNISFGLNMPCQCRCSYCRVRNALNSIPVEQKRLLRQFSYKLFFKALTKRGIIAPNPIVFLSSGEITIDNKKDEILDCVNTCRLHILSNAILFDVRIAKLPNIVDMLISVDSGTHETYKTIKGIEAFDIVFRNISKYVEYGVNVTLKYIFLEENCNSNDVLCFMQNAVQAGIKEIQISQDANRDYNKYSEQNLINGMVYMIKLCCENGIRYKIMPEKLGTHNISQIKSELKNE